MAQAIKRGDMELYLSALNFEVKEVEGEDRTLRFIGSDETPDRDNDIIEVNGWELANYRKNPVFLWAHDYRFPPIGRAQKVAKDDGKLVFDIAFPPKGVFPFADLIFDLYKGKFLRATSVGFIPKKYEARDDEDLKDLPEWRRGRRYKKQELLELSAVPVPSNPNALEVARSKGFVTDEQAEALTDFMNGKLGCSTKACKAIEGMWKADAAEDVPPVEVDMQARIVTVRAEDGEFRSFTFDLLQRADFGQLDVLKRNSDEFARLTQFAVENQLGQPGDDTVDLVIALLESKAGAVLSKKNKECLSKAQTLIQEVLDSAADPEEENGDKNVIELETRDPEAPQVLDLDAIEVPPKAADDLKLNIAPETLKAMLKEVVKEELDLARGKVN